MYGSSECALAASRGSASATSSKQTTQVLLLVRAMHPWTETYKCCTAMNNKASNHQPSLVVLPFFPEDY